MPARWSAATTHLLECLRCVLYNLLVLVNLGSARLLAQHIGLEASFKPAVRAYSERLQGREGFRRAMAAQERAAIAQGVPTMHVANATGPS